MSASLKTSVRNGSPAVSQLPKVNGSKQSMDPIIRVRPENVLWPTAVGGSVRLNDGFHPSGSFRYCRQHARLSEAGRALDPAVPPHSGFPAAKRLPHAPKGLPLMARSAFPSCQRQLPVRPKGGLLPQCCAVVRAGSRQGRDGWLADGTAGA